MMLIICECGNIIAAADNTFQIRCNKCKEVVNMYGKPVNNKPPKPVGVMTLDDMLEAGDESRINVEAHGLIAFFLNNTFEDCIDLEAECLEIIRKKYLEGKITKNIMRSFYINYNEEGGDGYYPCTKCKNYYKEEDVFLCEHSDELVCENCCGEDDDCQECWKERNKLERCENEKE